MERTTSGHDHSLLAGRISSSRKSEGTLHRGIKSTRLASLMKMKENEMDGRGGIERANGKEFVCGCVCVCVCV